MKSWNEAKDYIEKLTAKGSSYGLENIKELLRRLDNPQDKLSVIHIAGTNGKGSVGAFLQQSLIACGKSVGRYVSPTLFTYLERFSINGELMSEQDFTRICSHVAEVASDMTQQGFAHPSAFEIETAISFLYFLEKEVDYVLLECGLGGRTDATNVLSKPVACVFTSISFDHMEFLGDTIQKIATEKSGIMRENVPVIVARQPDCQGQNALETLKENAKALGCPFYNASSYLGEKLELGLKGAFQQDNVAAALQTVAVILKDEYVVHYKEILEALKNTYWPGRFQTISSTPCIIVDGAHNADAARCLYEALDDDTYHFIMGVFKDKAYHDMLEILLPKAKSLTCVNAGNLKRSLDPRDLKKEAQSIFADLPIFVADSIKEALIELKLTLDSKVVICGSLSISKEAAEAVEVLGYR